MSDVMRFPGDRMMTDLLSRLSRAGVREITLGPSMGIISISPRRWPHPLSSRRSRINQAGVAVARLLADPKREPLYYGRTFAQALAFRSSPMFEKAEGRPITIAPGRYEARAAR